MAKVIVLGGAGVVGTIAVKTLSAFSDFTKVVIADINEARSKEIIDFNPDKITFRKLDVNNRENLRELIKEFDIIVNTIGPFYRYGPLVLETTIEAGKAYVDVNDDVDATREVLQMDQKAKDANVTAIIGLGSSPGVTNILAKFAAEQMLDKVNSIDLYHAHGGEPVEGPGVIFHRIHAMTIDIDIFIDGKSKTVKFLSKEGIALEEDVDFEN